MAESSIPKDYPTSDNALRVVADFQIPESLDIEEFITAVKSFQKETATHEGVVQYDFLQNTEDRRAFTMFERWASKEALDKHLKEPAAVPVLEQLTKWGVKLTIRTFTLINSIN